MSETLELKQTTRRPVLGTLLLGTLLLGTLALPACHPAPHTDTWTPEGDVHSVILDIDAGTIDVIPGDTLRIERTLRSPRRVVTLERSLDSGVLRIGAHCASLLPCAVDTELSLPDGVSAEIHLDHGEVWATDVGDLSVALGRGDADLDVEGDLMVQVGSGQVQATLVAGVRARVTVGEGDIHVQVPPVPWAIEASASRLSVEGVVSDDSAVSRLDLVAPSGVVTVRRTTRMADRR